MKKLMLLTFIFIIMLGISGCSSQVNSSGSGSSSQVNSTGSGSGKEDTEGSAVAAGMDTSEMFTGRDYEIGYEETESIRIRLNGNTASCSLDAVRISGSKITISEEGTYILTGTLDDGMVVVNAKDTDKIQLVLNGVSIHSETSAPVYILNADKVFITLAKDTTNTLSNGGTFTAVDDNNIDATVFSKQDLSFNGSGSLTITSPAGHGIVCKDDLVFTSGAYAIQVASHGIDANDSVRAANASITIKSGKDGIHAENTEDTSLGFVYIASGTFQISAEGDSLSASASMQIDNGSFDINSGGGSVNAKQKTSGSRGEDKGKGGRHGRSNPDTISTVEETDESTASMKGIKAGGNLVITNGTFTIDSEDDAVHSNTSVTVSGGSFEVASGDDAFHADKTLAVTGGTINITGSYEGLEGLHVDISGGDIQVVASDDGINAAGGSDQSGLGGHRGNDQFGGDMGGGNSSESGSIHISGGDLTVHASGDGLDANGTLAVTGGMVTVSCPVSGDTSVLDFDASGEITGGTFIGTGASRMAQTFDSSSQGVIFLNAGTQSAGSQITLADGSGNIIHSYESDQSFDILIYSSPEIVKGETYTITVGASEEKLTAS